MTGPKHYRLAEDWLAEAADQYERVDDPAAAGRLAAAIAAGHAQLAEAAAVAELDAYADPHGVGSAFGRNDAEACREAWDRVLVDDPDGYVPFTPEPEVDR